MGSLAVWRRPSIKGAILGVALVGMTVLGLSTGVSKAAAADCDANAVIWCGAGSAGSLIGKYDHGDGHNSAASIQHIYGSFGISSSDIHAMGSTSQMGSVTSSGDVSVGGQVVAISAMTAGRLSDKNFSCGDHGSETLSNVGRTKFYKRPPSSSFCSSPLQALVVMKNGVFQFAILTSCGNPVTGQPKPKPTPPAPQQPGYQINKDVALKGTDNYSKNLSVKAGTHVIYRVKADSTGQADVTGLKVSDNLPNHVSFVTGSLELNGQSVDAGHFFDSGYNIGTLAAGSSATFTFDAIVGPNDTTANCQAQSLGNTGTIMATSLPAKNSTATVNEQCQPKPKPPVVACTSLTSTPVSREAFSFTAKASAQNSTIKSYSFNFGDGSAAQMVPTANGTATAQHQYTTPGNYTASVSVTFSNASTPVTSAACQTPITVAPAPAAECTNLQLTSNPSDQRDVSATVSYQATNGATLQSVTYDFGDGTAAAPTTETTMQHTYQQDGNFTVTATLTFSGTGAPPASVCQAPLSIATAQPTCNLLQVTPGANEMVTISDFQTTDNGGTLTGADIDWGDGNTDSSVNPVIGQTHQYAAPEPGASATYTITAVPHFTVNGQDITANSSGCSQQVTFTTPVAPTTPTTPTTPVTPSTPSTPVASLVNTGAGSVIAVFILTTGAGTLAYRRHLRHMLNR